MISSPYASYAHIDSFCIDCIRTTRAIRIKSIEDTVSEYVLNLLNTFALDCKKDVQFCKDTIVCAMLRGIRNIGIPVLSYAADRDTDERPAKRIKTSTPTLDLNLIPVGQLAHTLIS